jgi:hypothetical protein
VLTGFRQRLIDHGLEEKVLDLLLARLAELGMVKAGGRQRTDATHVLAAVRAMNRLEFLAETLRAALEVLSAAAPDWLATHIDAEWVQRYGARADSYRLPQGEDKRTTMAVQVGADGFDLLEAIHADHAPAWLREVPAVVVPGEGVDHAIPPHDHRGQAGGGVAGGQRPPAQQRTDLFAV